MKLYGHINSRKKVEQQGCFTSRILGLSYSVAALLTGWTACTKLKCANAKPHLVI